MKCPKCGRELIIDHVEGKVPVFVCTDPRCSEYRKARTEEGEEKDTQIKERV